MLETVPFGNTLSHSAHYNLANGMLINQTIGTDPSQLTTLYFLTDAQGSTRAMTETDGDVKSSYAYDAFGNLQGDILNADTKYLYTGQQYDFQTELYSLRARYYDPSIGRFTSRDTWAYDYQNPVELNRYVYAAGNPIRYSDPSGNSILSDIKAWGKTLLATTAATIASYGEAIKVAGQRAYWYFLNIWYRTLDHIAKAHPLECLMVNFATDVDLTALGCGINPRFQGFDVEGIHPNNRVNPALRNNIINSNSGGIGGGGSTGGGVPIEDDWVFELIVNRQVDRPPNGILNQQTLDQVTDGIRSDLGIGTKLTKGNVTIFEVNGTWYLGLSRQLDNSVRANLVTMYGDKITLPEILPDYMTTQPYQSHSESDALNRFRHDPINRFFGGSASMFTTNEPCGFCVQYPNITGQVQDGIRLTNLQWVDLLFRPTPTYPSGSTRVGR